jgi:hypothetical protein
MKNTIWLGQDEKHHLSVSMKNTTWLGQYEKHHLSLLV